MKNILRTGIGMLALSVVLTAASVVFIKAHAATTGADAASSAEFSEKRSIDAGVVNVVISGPIDLNLRQSSTPELLVKGGAKLVEHVTTRIEGNTLYVGTRGIFISIGSRQSTRVELGLPNLEKLKMEGSGDGAVKGFRGNRIELSMHGSGDLIFDGDYVQVQSSSNGSGDLVLRIGNADRVELSSQGSGETVAKGQTKVLNARLTGSGDLDASMLRATQANVTSMGSSDTKVFASQDIKLKLMGSGDVVVFGKPAARDVQRMGSGEVRWD